MSIDPNRNGILLAMLAGFTLSLSADAGAQQVSAAPGSQAQPLRVFLDCEECDFDHFRREVTFVDYVREPNAAQLHVLVTSQGTGGGGTEHTFFLIGKLEFEGRQDTLRWVSAQSASEDDVREGLVRMFKLGLIPFAARTSIADALSVDYEPVDTLRPVVVSGDPWRLWVFRSRVGGSMQGESRSRSVSFEGSLSASRTTEQIKMDFELGGQYEEDQFELRDSTTFISATRDWEADAVVVWSLGPHWSAGFTTRFGSEPRVNHRFTASAGPALEYSLFPYAQSTRKQITVTYSIGPAYFDYDEITLFDQLQESQVEQELEISAEFQQPWGQVDGSIEWSNYMRDFSLHRIDFFGGFEVRLFRGLNLDINGNVARIKNQIYVPREDVPDEEILLRRRELGTDFEYELDFGLSFTFGSIFNNVVNPRLSDNRRF